MTFLDSAGLRRLVQALKDRLVPNTRRVNNHVLSADITLSASDIGAVPAEGFSAAAVPFSPPDGMAATNVHNAIVEVSDRTASDLPATPPADQQTWLKIQDYLDGLYAILGTANAVLTALIGGDF